MASFLRFPHGSFDDLERQGVAAADPSGVSAIRPVVCRIPLFWRVVGGVGVSYLIGCLVTLVTEGHWGLS